MKDNGIFQALKIALTEAVSTRTYTKKDKEHYFVHKSVYLKRLSKLYLAFSSKRP